MRALLAFFVIKRIVCCISSCDCMSELSDEKIATLVQAGDAEAFGELISRYEAKLKRYARKFLNSEDDIEDLVQDVFIKSYMNIQSFNTTLRFSPWIYRIAHNTFVNELKRKHRMGFFFFNADTILPQLPSKETADSGTLNAELREELDILIKELPPKYREVIILHYLESLSYQEISDILQIPVTTVGVRMTRAREKLRECYTHKHPYHE